MRGGAFVARARVGGARATSSLATHFAKQNTKFGGSGKTRAGKSSFPQSPSFFARPNLKVFQNSASGFSRKKVGIYWRKRKTPPLRREAKIVKHVLCSPFSMTFDTLTMRPSINIRQWFLIR